MALKVTLTARGVGTDIFLWEVSVDDQGEWTYESRGVEHARGRLTRGDQAQLISLYERVDWDKETLNNPVSADDRILFRLVLETKDGDRRIYQFSEAMNHLSWQLRDLVHFLRHNVATAQDPATLASEAPQEQPPAVHP